MPYAALGSEAADFGEMLVSLVSHEGSASHAYAYGPALNGGPHATRNLADVIHLFCSLQGAHPGLLEIAADQNLIIDCDQWFLEATSGFANERAYLAQLGVAAGPVPSTPGESETAAVLLSQRHALEMIGRSERFGCTLGAAAGLVLDWHSVRATLDMAAERLGVSIAPVLLPSEETTAHMLAALPDHQRLDRTLSFGARQLLLQHTGLWDLLETRANARGDA
jgi:hypothetical protein